MQKTSIYLFQLINTNHWLSVQLTLLKLYPSQEESITAYKDCYTSLQNIPAVKSNVTICLEQEFDEYTGEPSVGHVYGIDPNHFCEITNSNSVALGAVHWNEWLGMSINQNSLNEFNELEIISHCLYEMTFYGFTEKEIQREINSISNVIDNYRKNKE